MTAKIMQIFDYAKCISIYYPTRNSLTKQRRNKAPQRVGKEVPPIGRTRRSKYLLTNLNETTKGYRSYDGPGYESLCFSLLMTSKVLKPQH